MVEDHPRVEDHHTAAEQGDHMMRLHVIVQRQKPMEESTTRFRVLESLPYSRSREGFLYKHLSTTVFCTFFTDEVWDLLVKETNRYSKLGFPPQWYA